MGSHIWPDGDNYNHGVPGAGGGKMCAADGDRVDEDGGVALDAGRAACVVQGRRRRARGRKQEQGAATIAAFISGGEAAGYAGQERR